MIGHSAPALSVDSLGVRYGGVAANSEVSISVRPGQVVGLIGPNGAGKTTFVDAVSGFVKMSGQVMLGDTRIDRLPTHRRRRLGLSRTWQSGELFPHLTVAENVMVSSFPGGVNVLMRDIVRRGPVRHPEAVATILDLVGLGDLQGTVAGELPLGQQKLVGVARALAGRCSVLLLDEPAAGLDSDESAHLTARIRLIADSGVGVLLIDHDMSLVFGSCDHIAVMEAGKVIFTGSPDEAALDDRVVEAYLGAPMEKPHE